MKKSVKLFTGITCMVSNAFLVQWLMCFSAVTSRAETVRTPFWILAAALSLTFVINCLLLEKGVSLPVYFIVQILETAVTVFLFIKFVDLQPFGIGTCVFGAGLTGIFSLSAAYSAYFPTGKNALVLRFDVCCIGIIILLLLMKATQLPDLQRVILCGGFSMLLLLCGIVSISAGALASNVYQGSPGKGRFVIVAIGILVVLAAAAVYAFGSGMLSSFSHVLAGGFKSVGLFLFSILKFIWEQFVRFMLWLSSLVPAPDAVSAGAEQTVGMQQEEMDYGDFTLPLWMISIPIAAAVAIIAVVIIHFRRQHLRAPVCRISYADTKSIRTSGLKSALLRGLEQLKSRLIYCMDAFRYRNTAPGVYDWICRRLKKEKRKQPMESPSCFIRRIAPADAAEEFEALSTALEHCFYQEKRVSMERALCRKIRRASRKI